MKITLPEFEKARILVVGDVMLIVTGMALPAGSPRGTGPPVRGKLTPAVALPPRRPGRCWA